MKAGIPGTERRRASNSAPTKPTSTANGNNPQPPSPPAPEPTVHQRFTKELALILRGKRSEPGELYCPTAEFDSEKHDRICVLTDPVTKELFSFTQRLCEEHLRVPLARNAAGVEKMERAKATLKRQIQTLREVMYQHSMAAHPELESAGDTFELLDGWIIAKVATPAERMQEALSQLAESLGMPPGLVERLARDARERSSKES